MYRVLLGRAAEKDLSRLSPKFTTASSRQLGDLRPIHALGAAANSPVVRTTGASALAITASFMRLPTQFVSCESTACVTAARFIGDGLLNPFQRRHQFIEQSMSLDRPLLRRSRLDRSSVGVNPSPVPIVPGGTGAFVAHRAVTGGLARYLATDPVHIVGIEARSVNSVAPAAVAPLRKVIIAGLFAFSNLGMTENALRIRKIL